MLVFSPVESVSMLYLIERLLFLARIKVGSSYSHWESQLGFTPRFSRLPAQRYTIDLSHYPSFTLDTTESSLRQWLDESTFSPAWKYPAHNCPCSWQSHPVSSSGLPSLCTHMHISLALCICTYMNLLIS